MMRLSFIGMGYVGTVYAVGFASLGHNVVGYDISKGKLGFLRSGKSFFFEPCLGVLLDQAVKSSLLSVTESTREAVVSSDITFITVGTPSEKDGGTNLSYVLEASREIGTALREKSHHTVVVKSTVPPGTTGVAVKKALEDASGKVATRDFGLVMNPEFLKEGNALEDFKNPDRIIIGTDDQTSHRPLERLYAEFTCPKIITSTANAELIKYSNNAFLAMKVSFINMIANLCQRTPGSDVITIAKGIGLDSRIGASFLRAGAGWGGSCWPKDLAALKAYGNNLRIDLPLIQATMDVNKSQPGKLIDLARELIGDLKGKRIAILGLAFKPNTDDIREAVSIRIIHELHQKGAHLIVYDPVAMTNMQRCLNLPDIEYASSATSCLKNTDCALLVTEWDEFKNITPDDYRELMKDPCLVDGRRIYDPDEFKKKTKFKAIGLGA